MIDLVIWQQAIFVIALLELNLSGLFATVT
jgi:hypothetical protein